jgi:hypothetical protein
VPKSITLIPDMNGQIRLKCDDQEIVITVANPRKPADAPQPSSSPTEGMKSQKEDPFEIWKHNTQLIQSVPDGAYTFRTLGTHGELLKALEQMGSQSADPKTTHILRVHQRKTLEFGELAGLDKDAHQNVHVVFSQAHE